MHKQSWLFYSLSFFNSIQAFQAIRHNARLTQLLQTPLVLSRTGAVSNDSEIELYNDKGEEIWTDSLSFETLNFEDDVGDSSLNGDEIGNGSSEENVKKLIECNASILLPFGADVAFDAFSDLTRQPSWCKYLKSVEYIGFVDQEQDLDSIQIPLRQSKWTVSVRGLRFSWTAKDTSITRPNKIAWESTSGMKNSGCVEFTPHDKTNNTQMKLSFTFVAPRVVSSLFRRSNKLRSYTEDVLLMGMLIDFRDVVLEEDFQ